MLDFELTLSLYEIKIYYLKCGVVKYQLKKFVL